MREAWGTAAVVASDHAGVSLKAELVNWLRDARSRRDDQGPFDADTSVDYTGYAESACRVGSGEADLGLMRHRSRHVHGREQAPPPCALLLSPIRSRRVNTALQRLQRFVFGSRVVGTGLAQDIVAAWIDAEFEGGRHARRVEQIGRRMLELEALET